MSDVDLILLKSYSQDMEPTGYMNIFFTLNNRLFLDTIYCYDKYREKVITSNLSDIADFILQDYNDYVISGDNILIF